MFPLEKEADSYPVLPNDADDLVFTYSSYCFRPKRFLVPNATNLLLTMVTLAIKTKSRTLIFYRSASYTVATRQALRGAAYI
jgi:hypothetical protein